MRIGVVLPNQRATVSMVAAGLAEVQALGFDSAWMPGIPNGPDVLTLLAVAGRGAQLEMGPAVLPTYLRHPVALASQALTVNEAVGGRLTLGIGVSHQRVVEGMLGLDYRQPVRQMADYLRILVPLLEERRVSYEGAALRSSLRLDVAESDVAPPTVFIAALGPKMLELAGTLATGAATWMVGPKTLSSVIVPTVGAAAARAGRPLPRVLASLPFLLTHESDGGRAQADAEFGLYGRLPAYRAVLDREGVASPSGIAVVGDEAELAAGVDRLRDAGVTDLQITPFGDEDERRRTVQFLATLR